MKQIKLKPNITLIAVEGDSNLSYQVENEKKCETWIIRGYEDGYAMVTMVTDIPKSDTLTILGTATDFLARKDAEEVCRGWVHCVAEERRTLARELKKERGECVTTPEYIYKYYNYTGNPNFSFIERCVKLSALDSFQSALTAIGIKKEDYPKWVLIIKDERK